MPLKIYPLRFRLCFCDCVRLQQKSKPFLHSSQKQMVTRSFQNSLRPSTGALTDAMYCNTLYSQLNSLKLKDIHQLEIAKLMHNFHSNRMPNTFDRLFTAVNSVHTHKTRSSTSGQYFCHPVWKKINQIQRPKNLAANRFFSKRIASNHLQKTIQKLDYRKL